MDETNLTAATISTTFVALGTVALLVGRRSARRRNVGLHRSSMLVAVAAHAAFLAIFVWRFVRYGLTELPAGDGLLWLRRLVLFTHEPVAVVSVPMVLAAAALGLAKRVDLHRQLAPLAYVVWLFASVTGLALYLLLHLV